MLRLQNGKFDAPSRMFHSMVETWQGVLINPADVKEVYQQQTSVLSSLSSPLSSLLSSLSLPFLSSSLPLPPLTPLHLTQLIPEFYQINKRGSFLINSERLHLGVKDNREKVDDVILPAWASGIHSSYIYYILYNII